ncbi:hypothetical protein J6590_008480 [Homalodisca vitripennis]|nr:hypothetical protein J6590_008480 [Homalodisca vitripennis]
MTLSYLSLFINVHTLATGTALEVQTCPPPALYLHLPVASHSPPICLTVCLPDVNIIYLFCWKLKAMTLSYLSLFINVHTLATGTALEVETCPPLPFTYTSQSPPTHLPFVSLCDYQTIRGGDMSSPALYLHLPVASHSPPICLTVCLSDVNIIYLFCWKLKAMTLSYLCLFIIVHTLATGTALEVQTCPPPALYLHLPVASHSPPICLTVCLPDVNIIYLFCWKLKAMTLSYLCLFINVHTLATGTALEVQTCPPPALYLHLPVASHSPPICLTVCLPDVNIIYLFCWKLKAMTLSYLCLFINVHTLATGTALEVQTCPPPPFTYTSQSPPTHLPFVSLFVYQT